MSLIFIYALAMFIGILITVVPIMNAVNTKVLGTFRVSFIHYFSAAVTGVIFLVFTTSIYSFKNLSNAPIYYFFGGILGLSVILLMNYYAIRIKALHITVLPFLGQMTMGLILDYFIFDKLNVKTIIGLMVVLIGLYIQSDQNKKQIS